MKTFYVLWDGVTYLESLETIELGNDTCYYWHPDIGAAHRFESLPQALEFVDSSGLQLDVFKVEITVAYTPNLFTEKV